MGRGSEPGSPVSNASSPFTSTWHVLGHTGTQARGLPNWLTLDWLTVHLWGKGLLPSRLPEAPPLT